MNVLILALSGLALLAPPRGSGEAPAPAPVRAVPRALVLGSRPAGSTVHASVFVVNPSEHAVRLTGAKAGCGCTTVEFEPTTLAPGAFVELPLALEVPPEVGREKAVELAIAVEGAAPLLVPLSWTSVDSSDPSLASVVVATPGTRTARVSAETTRWSGVEPGAVLDGRAWILNPSDVPLEVRDAKASCGCTSVADELPQTVPPGGARSVRFRLTAPSRAEQRKSPRVVFRTSADELLVLDLEVMTR